MGEVANASGDSQAHMPPYVVQSSDLDVAATIFLPTVPTVTGWSPSCPARQEMSPFFPFFHLTTYTRIVTGTLAFLHPTQVSRFSVLPSLLLPLLHPSHHLPPSLLLLFACSFSFYILYVAV